MNNYDAIAASYGVTLQAFTDSYLDLFGSMMIEDDQWAFIVDVLFSVVVILILISFSIAVFFWVKG